LSVDNCDYITSSRLAAESKNNATVGATLQS